MTQDSHQECGYGARPVSAHPRVQLNVYDVSASWHSQLGQDTPSRYLTIGWNTCELLQQGNQHELTLRSSTALRAVSAASSGTASWKVM